VEESGNYALNAIDGSDSTRWCASDANTGHWWKVDLGTIYSLGGCQIIWEKNGNPYQYLVEVSNDDINYTTALDNTSNYSTNTQIQYSDFPDATKGRYVRITVTGGLETNTLWASFYNFAVLGRALPVAIHRNNPKNDMATALTVTNNVSATTINYSVVSAGSAHIDLRIYDARGSVVKTLVNGLAEPGTYSVIFDGRNNDGKRLTAGQYICCFRSISENGTVVEKTTVVPMVR
jgi:hypothetical protein